MSIAIACVDNSLYKYPSKGVLEKLRYHGLLSPFLRPELSRGIIEFVGFGSLER